MSTTKRALRPPDFYLSTLRRFIAAARGTLELRIELRGSGVMRLTGVGEIDVKRRAA